MSAKKIVVVGSINADLTTRVARHPHPGETLIGAGGHFSAGGKGANQAVAAALLGANVTLVGATGDDLQAQAALQHFDRAGIDQSHITVVDEPTGLAVITVSDDGENTIIVIPGANGTITKERVEKNRDVIANAEIVLLQGEIPSSGFNAAVDMATGRVVVNLAPVVPVGREQLLQADPLLANEHEAALVLEQLGEQVTTNDPHELASSLVAHGFRSVVLTLGAAGALVATPEHLIDIPTPTVQAVDTTGAGDAFAGALVAQLAEGENLVDAAHFAARVGAAATLRPGAQDSYPSDISELPEVNNEANNDA
ncbi:ribokinase [Corynebacterium cystitidis]|uniref:Ribokinase n=1 Tax=Corynebacterium cystitidis DSM 20524 TaxID=1121357 RepID=A0A1H9QJG1_9CORY|nr:ribokinase [Corynebacterium cystitidis]WJY81756.1 Ribokinase [Corynebacterium cystitidis DSM 20524]SER60568.1 ribokinase [Corynebacterium cystitidis DSM 20524]SNV83984.1 ribokinase [Corynebacterium cystitidis]